MRPVRVLRSSPAAATAGPAGPSAGRRAGLPAPAAEPAPARRREVRPEIQALRAVAVLLVLLYHLWPGAVPGGFVGVDVFFAISGFLITRLLVDEIERTGTVSLTAFWARRARRLLPAALLVIAACALATLLVVPSTRWEQFFADMRASATYVQNWHLADTSTDYFAADDGPSPVQHFWSLSAEEQYYLVWPVLLFLAAALARGRARLTRRSIAGVLGAVGVLSLAGSIAYTTADPTRAYFVTPTRAWEFAAGGLLALLPAVAAGRDAWRAGLAWLGLGAIVLAALRFDDDTAFPGLAALLPVLGALAIIRAGTTDRRWGPRRLWEPRPVQFLGDISYSVYLWHWPLLVLAPFVLGRAVGDLDAVAILGLTILAAWLTKLLVEDPVRFARPLTRRAPGLSLAVAAAATLAVVGVTVAAAGHVEAQITSEAHATHALLAHKPRCFGAAARDPERRCENPRLRTVVVPSPLEAPKMRNADCSMIERRSRLRVCAFGASSGHARETVAVVGDSHASALRPALAAVARARGWRGLSITRTGCAFTAATMNLEEPARSHCTQWNREVRDWFAGHPEVRTVIATARAGGDVVAGDPRGMFATASAGYAGAWRALAGSVRNLIVIRDTPRMRGNTLDCVQRAVDAGGAGGGTCTVPRRIALQPDPEQAAAARVGSPRVSVVDLTRSFCDARRCYAIIGGALAFKDQDHVTPTFAATLGRPLRRGVDQALTRSR
jgi:peptidoglycan/LPS O-acetylase OafA/YrhL